MKQYVAKIGRSKTKGRKNLTNLANSSKATNTGNKPKTKRKFTPSSSAAVKRKVTNVVYVPPGSFPFQRVALKYVQGNIRSCYGCHDPIKNPADTEVEQLILVYRDTEFEYGNDSVKHHQGKVTSMHFHLNSSCATKKYPDFQPGKLYDHEKIRAALNAIQVEDMRTVFPSIIL